MIKYSAKLDPAIRASLGNIRSDFVEHAFVRFVHLKDALQNDNLPPQIRLLLLKEIFSIFDEIQAVYDIKTNFSNPKCFEGIFEFIVFVRNVLLHYPIFDTWDQINISPEMGSEMMRDRKGGAKTIQVHEI
ncbi:hypothetical protein [Pedobacter sp. SL55]|uniref:hypothetical protein n=1 Tax=Pedobacter sp. SL55 TaxID=2995161 RepID=UPI00226DA7DB|nr:hypothetical protein [Pedobacter sp. SL55]WAC39032.1 hypothetical protein OVA16_10430 [Pedobacter sp. SL55]